MRILLLATLLSATVPLLPAQAASVSLYGTGCAYAGQNLAIGVQGLPQLGTTITITYSGPNFFSTLMIQPGLALGLAPDATPIPTSVLPLQPAGCTVWVVPVLIGMMLPTSAGPFATSVDVAVPNNPGLIGFTVYAQWIATVVQCGIIPPCTFDALPTSDAAQLVLGT
jgi:hypothetical protein